MRLYACNIMKTMIYQNRKETQNKMMIAVYISAAVFKVIKER